MKCFADFFFLCFYIEYRLRTLPPRPNRAVPAKNQVPGASARATNGSGEEADGVETGEGEIGGDCGSGACGGGGGRGGSLFGGEGW